MIAFRHDGVRQRNADMTPPARHAGHSFGLAGRDARFTSAMAMVEVRSRLWSGAPSARRRAAVSFQARGTFDIRRVTSSFRAAGVVTRVSTTWVPAP
jgi:hypothetical protein